MGLIQISLQMVVLAVPIAIGIVARKTGRMGSDFDVRLTRLVLDVCMPCMIVSSVDSATLPAAASVARILGVSLLAYVVAFPISLLLGRLIGGRSGEWGAWSFVAMFGNIGFIGFPVLTAIFGQEALVYAVIAALPANLFIFSVGPIMAAGGSFDPSHAACELVRTLRIPPMLASLAVLALALLGVNDLGVVGEGLAVAGRLTTPAALLVTGSSLAGASVRRMLSSPRAVLAGVCRLIVVPVFIWAALHPLLQADCLLRCVIVVSFGMPLASNAVLYRLQAGRDPLPMLQATFVTVVFSLVTIPVLATLVAALLPQVITEFRQALSWFIERLRLLSGRSRAPLWRMRA